MTRNDLAVNALALSTGLTWAAFATAVAYRPAGWTHAALAIAATILTIALITAYRRTR